MDGLSQTKLKKLQPRVYLSDTTEVKFKRGSRLLLYRTSFSSEETTELDFLKNNFQLNVPPAKSVSHGIPKDKKSDIIKKLAPLMENNQKIFWNNIPTGDVKDLIDNDDWMLRWIQKLVSCVWITFFVFLW